MLKLTAYKVVATYKYKGEAEASEFGPVIQRDAELLVEHLTNIAEGMRSVKRRLTGLTFTLDIYRGDLPVKHGQEVWMEAMAWLAPHTRLSK